MVRVALAPCSPFSVTPELMAETAQLARRRGVRLHTHLAETLDEEVVCVERFGVRPVQYLEDLGWLGEDVWLAHCVHLSAEEIARFGATGTGVAHCPAPTGAWGPASRPWPTSRARARPSAWGRRRRLQRVGRPGRRAARGAALRAPGRRPGRDHRPRRAGAGHHRGRALPGPRRRAGLAGGRQAGRRRAVAPGRPGPRRDRGSRRGAGPRRAAPGGPAARRRAPDRGARRAAHGRRRRDRARHRGESRRLLQRVEAAA
jgi:hypothetical protein